MSGDNNSRVDPNLALAQSLIDEGIPVVVCTPSTRDDVELNMPKGWATITAAECDLSSFSPGVDALALVGGHGVDVVDVDTKDDGSKDNLPAFTFFGETRTPSGGAHYYVRSTGFAKMSPLTTSAGHVGDYVGGTVDGGGRMLAFLPGSTRRKYPDGDYKVVTELELDALLESAPDDNLVGALMGAGGRLDGEAGKPAVSRADVTSFLAEHSEIGEVCDYGRAAMKGILAEAASTVVGDPMRGRHGWAMRSAARVVDLCRAGCANAADLDDLERELNRIKPDGDASEFAGILSWAIANTSGTSDCQFHNPVDLSFTSDSEPEAASVVAPVDGDDGYESAAAFDREVAQAAHRLAVQDAALRQVKASRQGNPVWPPVEGLGAFLAVVDEGAEYRIEGIWTIGGRIVLTAQFKAGKSTLIGNVVRCLADGGLLLGTYRTTPCTVVLIDNELDPRTLRRWLRDQDIVNVDSVRLVSLRGKTSSFDILDPETRTRWAKQLVGADVVIFDCLRPILDALGLSEDKDAGRFLVAFDMLLEQAGAAEACVVHHMGHNAERSRGDSRILDWPDATWKLVRESADDPSSPRFFSAFGRDVDVPESRLDYDPRTRRLTLAGGSRKSAAADSVFSHLIELLTVNPAGLSKNKIEIGLGALNIARVPAREAMDQATRSDRVEVFSGSHNSKIYRLLAGSPDLATTSLARSVNQFAGSPYRANGELPADVSEAPALNAPANWTTPTNPKESR